MEERIIYIKGGRAIEEAHRLIPRIGELPDGGPDKFLLAVMYFVKDAAFRLVSLGPETIRTRIGNREIVEYGARSQSNNKLRRRFAFLASALALLTDSIRFRPTRLLCGLDGPIGLFAWLAARLTGAQFVFLGHSALAMPSTSKPYKLANRFLCRHADKVIAHGPFVRDEAIRLGALAGNVIEFNNALDKEHIELIQSFPPKPDHPEKHVIVYVGRIEEDKQRRSRLARGMPPTPARNAFRTPLHRRRQRSSRPTPRHRSRWIKHNSHLHRRPSARSSLPAPAPGHDCRDPLAVALPGRILQIGHGSLLRWHASGCTELRAFSVHGTEP